MIFIFLIFKHNQVYENTILLFYFIILEIQLLQDTNWSSEIIKFSTEPWSNGTVGLQVLDYSQGLPLNTF